MGLWDWISGRAVKPAEPPAAAPTVSLAGRGRGYCDYDIVGESHYQDNLEAIAGGHRRETQHTRVVAELRPEPQNEHDANAVAVFIANLRVGYIPARKCRAVVDQLAALGAPAGSRYLCQAEITGGWRTNQYDEGHFGVRLDLAIPLRRG